ncbi:unnamed protein product [Prorocentrum cordatum]|uniref:PDZ domain-containing protein n=1 Tax=Prorocentrum cordatum TaxID=2364126 RepID=A0ABN9X812_9DINO|nr:unnamed protein product [Polarella glacialis]
MARSIRKKLEARPQWRPKGGGTKRGPRDGPHTQAEAAATSGHLLGPPAGIRSKLEEERGQAVEPRGWPAADVGRQVHLDACCSAAPPSGLPHTPGGTSTGGMPPRRAPPQASGADIHEPRRPPSPCAPGGQSGNETRAGSESSRASGLLRGAAPTGARPCGRAGVGPDRGRGHQRVAAQERQVPMQEFAIILDKRFGDVLGVKVDTEGGDDASLCIEHIMKSGLLPLWNANNPQKPVKIGDRIIDVNGQRGSAANLIAQLQQFQLQQIIIGRKAQLDTQQARALRGPVAAVAIAPAAHEPSARLSADRTWGPLDGRWFDSCGEVGTIAGSIIHWAHRADDSDGTTELTLTGVTVHMNYLGQMLCGVLQGEQFGFGQKATCGGGTSATPRRSDPRALLQLYGVAPR